MSQSYRNTDILTFGEYGWTLVWWVSATTDSIDWRGGRIKPTTTLRRWIRNRQHYRGA